MGLSFSAPVGAVAGTVAQRTLMAVTAVLLVAAPLPSVRAAAASLPDDTAAPAADVRLLPSEVASLDLPRGDRFTDTDLALAITPPGGWMQSPVTALNPLSDPPEPEQESARFQLRIQDTQLYATPIPITSGLVADAGALISIGVARVGSDILDLDRRGRGTRELGSVPGFTVLEDEATYDGLHVLTRYLFSRETDRVLVLRVDPSCVDRDVHRRSARRERARAATAPSAARTRASRARARSDDLHPRTDPRARRDAPRASLRLGRQLDLQRHGLLGVRELGVERLALHDRFDLERLLPDHQGRAACG